MHNKKGLQCFQRSFEIYHIPSNHIIVDKVHMFMSDLAHFTFNCYIYGIYCILIISEYIKEIINAIKRALHVNNKDWRLPIMRKSLSQCLVVVKLVKSQRSSPPPLVCFHGMFRVSELIIGKPHPFN